MPLTLNDPRVKNQLASDWMHQGIDLANECSPATLERAVRCFDEAIALRRTLPLDENHFYRYGLSAGWINRGDALAWLGGDTFLSEAVKSYDEALVLLESLPLEEDALYPRRLAITWINRGIALQKRKIPNGIWEAVECFREAVGILEQSLASAIPDSQSLLAGAWSNLAGALMEAGEEDAEDIRIIARKALTLAKPSERTDLISAEVALKARHLLCRLAVKDIVEKRPFTKPLVAEATDAVDEALALARHWKFQNQSELAKRTCDIFRFGCRIYGNSQPYFLAEFLLECFAPEMFGETISPDPETFDAAQAAVWSALDKLQPDDYQFMVTPHFESFLSDVEELRKVEERLKQLRLAMEQR